MGLSGIYKSIVSRFCNDIAERVGEFFNRSLAGEWSYVWLDATYLKQPQGGRNVSVAAIIAVAANPEGRREIIGIGVGTSEAETFCMDFLSLLRARGLEAVKLVFSDAHIHVPFCLDAAILSRLSSCPLPGRDKCQAARRPHIHHASKSHRRSSFPVGGSRFHPDTKRVIRKKLATLHCSGNAIGSRKPFRIHQRRRIANPVSSASGSHLGQIDEKAQRITTGHE